MCYSICDVACILKVKNDRQCIAIELNQRDIRCGEPHSLQINSSLPLQAKKLCSIFLYFVS